MWCGHSDNLIGENCIVCILYNVQGINCALYNVLTVTYRRDIFDPYIPA